MLFSCCTWSGGTVPGLLADYSEKTQGRPGSAVAGRDAGVMPRSTASGPMVQLESARLREGPCPSLAGAAPRGATSSDATSGAARLVGESSPASSGGAGPPVMRLDIHR